jgi:hypothetical protein
MLPELTEASYFSRFFAKFVEIIAASLATATCAYLIAYLGGPLSPAAPAPASISAAPTTGEVAARLPARSVPPVAAAAVDEQHRAPQPVAEAPPAQPARKAEKAAMAAWPAPKDTRASTNAARSEKSAEALARAALANLDADRPPPADAPVRRVGSGSAPSAWPADVPPPRQAEIQPLPVEAQSRRVAPVDSPLPNAGPAPEIAAPQPELQADQHKGLFSFLRLGSTPSLAGEAPRPPLPVGTASPE